MNILCKLCTKIKLFRHCCKIRELRKQYANIPKQPSTGVRALWLIIGGGVAVIFATGIAFLLFGYPWIDSVWNLLYCIYKGEFQGVLNEDEFQSAFIYPLTLFVLSPIAFFVWLFRDQNKRLEIENTRKDTNLKEFQRLQEWATGNFSSNSTPTTLSDGNTQQEPTNHITLQISALHSLRPYLKGEYGESFRRGAYEIYRSLLKQRHNKILAQLQANQLSITRYNILEAIKQCELTTQLNTIAAEEWFNLLIKHDFPTVGMSLVGLNLSKRDDFSRKDDEELDLQGANLHWANLQGANLEETQLQGANLYVANLQGANLRNAQLQGTNLQFANLQGTNLYMVNLQGANLRYAQLQGANLRKVNLQGANLEKTQLQGANLQKAQLQGANLEKTQLQGVYSDKTILGNFVARITKRANKKANLRGIVLTALSDEQKNKIITLLKPYKDADWVKDAIKRIQDYEKISIQEWTNELTKQGANIGEYTTEEAKAMIEKYEEH